MGATTHWTEVGRPQRRSEWMPAIAEQRLIDAALRRGLEPPLADPAGDEEAFQRSYRARRAWWSLVHVVARGGRIDLLCASALRPAVLEAWEQLGREWLWHALLADDVDTPDRREMAAAISDAHDLLGDALGIEP